MFDFKQIINSENGFSGEEIIAFSTAESLRLVFNRHTKVVSWKIGLENAAGVMTINKLQTVLENTLNAEIDLSFVLKNQPDSDFIIENVRLLAVNHKDRDLVPFAIITCEDSLQLQFSNYTLKERADRELKWLSYDLEKMGIHKNVVFDVKRANKPKSAFNMNDQYLEMTLGAITGPKNKVKVNATIFKVEDSISARGGRSFSDTEIITYYLKDGTGFIIAKRFIKKEQMEAALEEYGNGATIEIMGDVVKNRMNEDLELHIRNIQKGVAPEGRKDTAEKKRIELHVHTKSSEMDGVATVSEYINTASKWGMEAIAITDHYVVQGYPQAQKDMLKLKKKDPDHPFKVIYGVEMNMVDPVLHIVKQPDGKSLNRTYVVFDLETTGLSNRYDHIIEFGGVKIQGGEVIDRLQCFVKPPVKLADFTKNLTNITDEQVESADELKDALPRIMEFFGDSCLVAHNARFDIGFINAGLVKLGLPQLTNPYIDTLDMARALLKERKSYRLGKVCSFYKINYDEDVAHRADYDAEVTSQAFMAMLNDVKKLTLNPNGTVRDDIHYDTVDDLQQLSGDDAFRKVNRRHITVLAKNQDGIKDLFRLVTKSHTDFLVSGGKVSTKNDEFIAEPRIPREEIEKVRANLLLGSACCNGEIFDLACTQSKDTLKEAMRFYDYIEVQAPENYRFLVENHSICDFDRLQTILTDIIECADELGIPVVATGDCHYCEPEEKIFRDVYIQAQGIGGSVHPLYIFNPEIRHKSVAPDQHFRTTDEMLEQFSFLDEETRQRIVVDNTHVVADQIDFCYPCKDKLYPPSIEGADDKLKNLCYSNAYARYGNPLPEIVSARLDKELTSILKNGYGVIYYTAHLMVHDSNAHGYMVGSRGSVGSSFVATMADITEVNPLAPHYLCPHCQHSEWGIEAESGFDLPDKPCPVCGHMMKANGQDIPFETFLGFYGDKVPDIDLNFSSEYQGEAMLYTKEVFGEDKVFRAGTISGVQEKTAYGYIRGYLERMGITTPMSSAMRTYLAIGCTDVKRTTGQHPGGIVVVPRDMDIHDFTPVQYPANDPSSEWRTTHLQFSDIHDNILKLDNLGHVDPTCMRLLEKVSGMDVKTIPMNDERVLSIFNSPKELLLKDKSYNEKTGALGLPEFGTRFVRGILAETRPVSFSQLVRISGLSHGTDVWANNAKELVAQGFTLNDVIGCRDDIMSGLIKMGLPAKASFDIMESVRKGRGLKDEWIALMRENNVPEWYIDSCLKIKYMFPKAHAVAYVMMAVRIAWFKVYKPLFYYIQFFTLRCDSYEIKTMCNGKGAVQARLKDIQDRLASKDREVVKSVSNKEADLVTTLEVCNELYCRGFGISKINLELSEANQWVLDPNNPNNIIPSFVTIDGLGYNVAKSIVDARKQRPFISKEDLMMRTQLSKTLCDKLSELGVLDGLQEENQMQLF